jgi:sugar lactone lactonase YvrE
VADTGNNRVLRFASSSALSNGAAAEGVLGQADFTSGSQNRGGGIAGNTLNAPYGIAVDEAGRLWVADLFNNRVLRFDSAASKANGADADGVLGQADFTHNNYNRGGGVAANTLYWPVGFAVD